MLGINHDNCINKQIQTVCNNDSHLIISQERDVGNDTASVISVYKSVISTERGQLLLAASTVALFGL